MRILSKALLAIVLGTLCLLVASQQAGAAAGEKRSAIVQFRDGRTQSIALDDLSRIDFKSGVTVVFKDGHQQSFPISEISQIQFDSGRSGSQFGRNYFLGKWEVGVGVGGGKFFITLEPNGQAKKTLGSTHGTWTFVDGEARISWDDGWHDAIRKVGSKHQKFAYEPGKTFSDPPSNVTDARNTTAEPI